MAAVGYTAHVRILLICAVFSAAALAAADASERVTVRGTITAVEDEPIVLTTDSGAALELIVEEADTFHTFHDPELADRTWELEGFHRGDNQFEVRALFTIKDGERFKVTYYCEICHITSYRPGMCMCCQEDVELREVPVTED